MNLDHITHHKSYARAFALYMRRGVPIDLAAIALEVKSDADYQSTHTAQSPYYILRTSGDDKVSPSHAANNGKIFAWDTPPPTGNPGKEFGCRCTAEPYDAISEEVYNSTIKPTIDLIKDYLNQKPAWNDADMSLYFYIGAGRGVTLTQMGHLKDIQEYYEANYLQRFETQIQNNFANVPDGPISNKFERAYDFKDVLFSYRMSTLHGQFEGNISTLPNGTRVIEGIANIQFVDWFSDPADLRQQLIKSFRDYSSLTGLGKNLPKREADLNNYIKIFSEIGGKPYPILDNWKMPIEIRK